MGIGQASGKLILDRELPASNTDAHLYAKLLGNGVGGIQGLYEVAKGADSVLSDVAGAPGTAGLSLSATGVGVIQAGHGIVAIKKSVNEIEKNANRLFAKRRKSSASNNSEVEQKELTRAKEFEKSLVHMNANERVAFIKTKLKEIAKEYGWEKVGRSSDNRIIFKDKDGFYYTIDTQHGRFEKFGKNRRHIDEVDIDLKPQGKHKPNGILEWKWK